MSTSGPATTAAIALEDWLGDQPRSPAQTHLPGESDAEVIRLTDNLFLASSTDSVEEEIAAGLYRDPYTAGWVAVMAGLSDIAAVGASPLGVLLTTIWGNGWGLEQRSAVARGVADALRRCGTGLLGGDTSNGAGTVVSVTALGASAEPLMSRRGARPGDVLCVTGSTGGGAALGASLLLSSTGLEWAEERYRPCARLREGELLRPFATACIDASDGVLRAVQALADVNGMGARLVWNEQSLDRDAVAYFRKAGLPLWWLWLAEHAEFELLLTIPPASLVAARAVVPDLHEIGELTVDPVVTVAIGDRVVPLDLADLPTFSGMASQARVELYVTTNAAIAAAELL